MTTSSAEAGRLRAVWGRPDESRDLALICFPHAGAGASVYGPFLRRAPKDLSVIAIQLPGRENRRAEAPIDQADALVDQLRPSIEAVVAGRPYALLGHSLGALLAFETARSICDHGRQMPAHLFVSARGAPHIPVPAHDLRRKPDQFFVDLLRQLGGTPEGAFESGLVDALLPALRADLILHEEYEYRYRATLQIPITALVASDDDRVDIEDVRGWEHHTAGSFDLIEHPGDHFALMRAPEFVLDVVAKTKERWR